MGTPPVCKMKVTVPDCPKAKAILAPMADAPPSGPLTSLPQSQQLSVSPGGWKPRPPALMPLARHPPSSGASTFGTRMPSAAASSPLRGPRKPVAIKQVGPGGQVPHALSGASGSEEGVPGQPVPTKEGQADPPFCRERRGGLGLPSEGAIVLSGTPTPTALCKLRLGGWSPDTNPCLTTGPDPAGPGDWPLPSAGETTDPPTSDPHLLPTAPADAQSCPHLDTSWQGGLRHPSTSPAPPDSESSIMPGPTAMASLREAVAETPKSLAIRMATLPESSSLLPFPCHLETNIRSLFPPLASRKGLKGLPPTVPAPPPPPARTL